MIKGLIQDQKTNGSTKNEPRVMNELGKPAGSSQSSYLGRPGVELS
jgi:hypothetical protein